MANPMTKAAAARRKAGIANLIGLILPAVLRQAPVFVALAATGLVVLMAGAAITHAADGSRRGSR